jgi:hypothetical protein
MRIALLRAELEAQESGEDFDPIEVLRPRTRVECASIPRPCPFVTCRHHLYLDVTPKGSLKLTFPGLEPCDIPAGESCSLDVSDGGSQSLYAIGRLLNVTRERARQIDEQARRNMAVGLEQLRDYAER